MSAVAIAGVLASRARRRRVAVVGAALLLAFAVALDLVLGGARPVPPAQVLAVLVDPGGAGSFLIWEVRLPRVVVLVLAGAALGLSGAMTQAAARTALVTPDLLGLPQGAVLGSVVLSGVVGPLAGWWGALVAGTGALFGATALAVAVLLLSGPTRRNPTWAEPARVVLMGITAGLAATAATVGLLATVGRVDPGVLLRFAVGGWASAGGARWVDAVSPAAGLLLAAVPAWAVAGRLPAYRCGDEISHGLGGDPARIRLLAVAAVIPALAGAVAAVGPVSFIALLAPPLARRLAATDRPSAGAAMLHAAALIVFCDVLAQAAGPWPVPVGAVTAIIGGPALAILVLQISGRHSA